MTNLMDGGYTSRDASVKWLVGNVQEFLGAGKNRACVFENAPAFPSDPWLKGSESNLMFFRNEVYHVLFGKSNNTEQIKKTILEAESADASLFIGVMCTFSTIMDEFETWPITVPREILEHLVQGMERLVVGAYDGEGYVIWDIVPVVAPAENSDQDEK